MSNLPEPSEHVDLIRRAHLSCFQIESPAMRTLAQHADRYRHVKTLSGRPGPSDSGMKSFARHLGSRSVPAPALNACSAYLRRDALSEDILKVANVIGDGLAGRPVAPRHDQKRSPKEMAKSMKTFIEAVAGGIAEAVADLGLIANFAAYSYCKAQRQPMAKSPTSARI